LPRKFERGGEAGKTCADDDHLMLAASRVQ
jgi:hypothetical protein